MTLDLLIARISLEDLNLPRERSSQKWLSSVNYPLTVLKFREFLGPAIVFADRTVILLYSRSQTRVGSDDSYMRDVGPVSHHGSTNVGVLKSIPAGSGVAQSWLGSNSVARFHAATKCIAWTHPAHV
ncbi:hypothetical protein A0H81_00922 [Grifola frondosa]|uniref:Uncharacterized protein n=1 Tax=Grifola frondosa TaxID=5627 RepID=A0A1C7MRY3_GRIFR|nr:hypothetical protein A0H81_00922 [Grifola frondosa]